MPSALRPASLADIDALAALEGAAFHSDRISRRSFRRLLASPAAEIAVAERAGSLVGCCVVLFREGSRIARLYSIAVLPSASGHGTGGILLDRAERIASGRGCDRLRLEVRFDNAAAIRWYERRGFRRSGGKPDYYADGMSALRYEKRLDRAEASAA